MGPKQASMLRKHGISPIETQMWDDKGLTPDEAVALLKMGKDLKTFPIPDYRHGQQTYSQTAKGQQTRTNWHGPVPFDKYLQDKLSGQSKARLAP